MQSSTLDAHKFLAQAEAIFACCPLRELRLLKAEREHNARELAGCAHLGRLRCLDLHSCKLGRARTEKIVANPHLAGLRELNLGYVHMRVGGAARVLSAENLAGLRSLCLNHNGLTDEVVPWMAGGPLTNLHHLDLGHNELTPDGVEQLGHIPHLRRLESLALYDMPSGDEIVRRLVASDTWGNLKKLDLSDTNSSPEGSKLLTQCPHLAQLTHLRIGGMLWPGDLARSPSLHRLRELDFTLYPQGPDAGMRALVDSPVLANLRALRVTGLATPYARVLFGSPACRGLVSLTLFNNYEGPTLARLIADCPYLDNLVGLEMWQCWLDDAAVTALANSPNLPRLARLRLLCNRIHDDGMLALVRSPYLGRIQELAVYAQDRYLQPTTVDALRERFGPALLLQ